MHALPAHVLHHFLSSQPCGAFLSSITHMGCVLSCWLTPTSWDALFGMHSTARLQTLLTSCTSGALDAQLIKNWWGFVYTHYTWFWRQLFLGLDSGALLDRCRLPLVCPGHHVLSLARVSP